MAAGAGRLRAGLRRATVSPAEREELGAWLSPRELRLFDWMHTADRRHGLDVVAYLRAEGVDDADLLMAALLHDSGKGPRVRLVHRVAWSLGQKYGAAKVSALYEFPARAGGTDPGEAARLAIHSVLGITQEQLIKNVNDWARTAVPAM